VDRRIKFRHLDAFSAIARAHSFKIAAEQLNLTQPAISKTLKELEDILGIKVMERSRAGVSLTPQGEVFLQFAEQSSAALRHGLRSIQASTDTGGHLKVGALPSVASSLLPKAVLTFAQLNPNTWLEIHEGAHLDLTKRLRSGDMDLVVGRLGKIRRVSRALPTQRVSHSPACRTVSDYQRRTLVFKSDRNRITCFWSCRNASRPEHRLDHQLWCRRRRCGQGSFRNAQN